MKAVAKIVIAVLAMSSAACSSIKPILPEVRRLDAPPISTTASEELGDTLLIKGQVRSYEALILSDNYVWDNG